MSGEPQPAAPRGPLARLAGIVLWVFAAGFAAGAAQVGFALHSGQAWRNYRGELLTHDELRRTLVLFVVAAGLCVLLALRWRRFLRRGD
jgi:ABC-type Fe3+ transport system permease subunit